MRQFDERVYEYCLQNLKSPPLRQIANELGVSVDTVYRALHRLTEAGLFTHKKDLGYFLDKVE